MEGQIDSTKPPSSSSSRTSREAEPADMALWVVHIDRLKLRPLNKFMCTGSDSDSGAGPSK